MKHINFQQFINIGGIIQETRNELISKYSADEEISVSSSFKNLYHYLNESLDKYDELKLFMIVYDSLISNYTRAFLQMKRLTEENNWLKAELEILLKKISEIDKSISVNNIDMIKLKYIYQIRLMINENDELPKSNNNYFGLLEIENDDMESYTRNPTGVISKKIRCLSSIIREYVCQGQCDIAITLCKQAINDIQQIKDEHPDIAILLCILGFLYKDLKKWDDAAACIFEALRIREKVFGPETSIIASTLNNLAIILTGNNKYFEAENLCRKALEIRIKLFGSKHESVAKQMNNLGLLLINIGLYSEGECLFHKALNVYKNLRNSELYFLKTSTNLANLYLKRGELDKTESQLKINLEMIFKCRFKSCPGSLNILKVYENKAHYTLDSNDIKSCLISDQYLVAEIVNVKFMIRLYEKEGKRSIVSKLKSCIYNFSSHLIEGEEELELLTDINHQKTRGYLLEREKASYVMPDKTPMTSTNRIAMEVENIRSLHYTRTPLLGYRNTALFDLKTNKVNLAKSADTPNTFLRRTLLGTPGNQSSFETPSNFRTPNLGLGRDGAKFNSMHKKKLVQEDLDILPAPKQDPKEDPKLSKILDDLSANRKEKFGTMSLSDRKKLSESSVIESKKFLNQHDYDDFTIDDINLHQKAS